MEIDILPLIDLFLKYRIFGFIIILLLFIYYLIRVILDEDKSAAWRARVYKAIYIASGDSKAGKRYIENDISSRLNLARRKMPFAEEYLPKAIKVKWIESGEGKSFSLKDNEIVVCLDPAESQEKNVVFLANALVKQTSLIGVRNFLEKPLEISMDLNLIKCLLKETGNRKILDWFYINEYHLYTKKSQGITGWNNKIVEIDEKGLFTRLLLVELDDFSKRISERTPTKEMSDEIIDLIEFLYKIATKSYGQEVPLSQITRNIKIGIILVGKSSKICSGFLPYIIAFSHAMKNQLSSIYMIQFDKEFLGTTDPEAYKQFVEWTKKLNQEIEKYLDIQKDFEQEYICIDVFGNRRKSKITHFIPKFLS